MAGKRAKVGRKRSEEAKEAIFVAALELLRKNGYGEVTVDDIASRAGVGKQTMYRWWPSKADVVLDALRQHARARIVDPDSGKLGRDLRAFLEATFLLLEGPRSMGPLMRGLMAEAQLDPAFGARFAEYIGWRRQALGAILRRAAERGEVRAEVEIEVLVDMLFGAMWYRLLTDRKFGKVFAEKLARLAVRAAAP